MSVTLLIDGNALAHTIDVKSCNSGRDFARKMFNKIQNYAKLSTSLCKMILFFDDKVGGTWRDNLYFDYQKNRKAQKLKEDADKKDENIRRSQYIKYIKDMIDSNGKITYLSYPHTETDDLVALYCKEIQDDGEKIIILTVDKDLYQLISKDKKKPVEVFALREKKFIKDEDEGRQILEQKIMLGDPSDSIPSVCSGVGPKYYTDLKKLLTYMQENNLDISDTSQYKKIAESANLKYINSFSNFSVEQLYINKKLVDLNSVLDLENKNELVNYIKDNLKQARISPFALHNIKLN